jgi:PhnB protein
MEMVPYVFFYGRCQEALDFYKSVFGGSYEAMRISDSPMKDQFPPEAANNIMHASFTAPSVKFFASDGREVKTVDPDAGNISLALNDVDGANAEHLVSALAEGGKIVMPLEPAFWGGKFAMVVDRFGNEWMITAS